MYNNFQNTYEFLLCFSWFSLQNNLHQLPLTSVFLSFLKFLQFSGQFFIQHGLWTKPILLRVMMKTPIGWFWRFTDDSRVSYNFFVEKKTKQTVTSLHYQKRQSSARGNSIDPHVLSATHKKLIFSSVSLASELCLSRQSPKSKLVKIMFQFYFSFYYAFHNRMWIDLTN